MRNATTEMSMDEACHAVGNLALKYGDGYAIYSAKGGWKDGRGFVE